MIGSERATELEPAESLTRGIRAEAAGGNCGMAAGGQEIQPVSLSSLARHTSRTPRRRFAGSECGTRKVVFPCKPQSTLTGTARRGR